EHNAVWDFVMRNDSFHVAFILCGALDRALTLEGVRVVVVIRNSVHVSFGHFSLHIFLRLHVVITSPPGSPHRTLVFRVIDSAFQGAKFTIPYSRRTTFREQLRLIRRAYDAFEGSHDGDQAFIESKMHEAFGDDVAVEVNRVPAAARLVR